MSFEPSLIYTDATTADVVTFETDIPTTVSKLSAVNKVAADVPTSLLVYLLKFCAIIYFSLLIYYIAIIQIVNIKVLLP
jgi:hypothetical protein